MLISAEPSDDIHISGAPSMIFTENDLVEWSQRQAMVSAKQFAPAQAKSFRHNTDRSRPSPAFEFDSFEYGQKMAMARLKREELAKGFSTMKLETDSTMCRHDIPSSTDDDGYASSGCETEASGHETPRANIRLLKEMFDEPDTNSKTLSLRKHPPKIDTGKYSVHALDDIDEEEELLHLKEQQEMISLEKEIRRKYEIRAEKARLEEQKLYIMRLEQLEMIRLQNAMAKESGKGFEHSSNLKRPTTAPAKRPARYLGEHLANVDGAEIKAAPAPTRPSTAVGPRKTYVPSSSSVLGGSPVGSPTATESENTLAPKLAPIARPRNSGWKIPLRRPNNAVGPSEDDVPVCIVPPEPTPEPEPLARKNAWL